MHSIVRKLMLKTVTFLNEVEFCLSSNISRSSCDMVYLNVLLFVYMSQRNGCMLSVLKRKKNEKKTLAWEVVRLTAIVPNYHQPLT